MKSWVTLGFLVALLSIACAESVPREFITFKRNSTPAPLSPGSEPNFQDTPANGSRIAYGDNASQGQFPFAAFVSGRNFACSGSLISPRVVMTAAHCVYKNGWTSKAGDIKVMLGSPDYYSSKAFRAKSLIIPSYNYYTNYGDIALIELATAAPYTPVPIASASSTLSGLNKVVAMGWGLNEQGRLSSALRYVSMSVLSSAQCAYQHSYYIGGSPAEDHICIGLDSGRESTCSGDSGGPYVTSTSNPIQIGVVSYGPASTRCGGSGNLDVPTSVIYWSDWIQNVLSLYNLRGSSTPNRTNKVADKQCFTSASVRTLTTSNAAGCCEECRRTSNCAAWTWTTSKQCALKGARGPTTRSNSCVSGYY
jgi:secreted trypsin-like serine protease